MQAQEYFGFFMPSKTSTPIVEQLAKAIGDVVKQPDVLGKFAEFSFEPMSMKPSEFAALMTSERERWAAIVKASGFQIDD